MTSGYGPSGPEAGAGGKAAFTSIGIPSKVLVVLRGLVLPQKRTPPLWIVQLTSPPNTLVMVASAAGAAASEAIATIRTASFRMGPFPRIRFPCGCGVRPPMHSRPRAEDLTCPAAARAVT